MLLEWSSARAPGRPTKRRPRGRRFVGRPGARAEDHSSNTRRKTYLRVTHNNSDRGEGPSREASRAWSPSLPHLGRGGRRDISHSVRGLLGRPKGRVRAGFALISKTLQNGVRWVGGLSRPSTVGTVGTYQYGTVGAIATEELRL